MLWIGLILLLALPLVWPFFQSGYFTTHDGLWAVVRQGAMHRAVMAGHFPVRWAGSLNHGYGYPLFLFTYPLPYYLGEVFNLAGFGLVNAVKLLFVISVFLSGLAMFWLGKELWGKWGGLLAAGLYLYAPFRLVDLYVRGSLGESLAFVFYPLLFLSVLKITRGKRIWVSLGALLLGGLFLTHNVSALFFMPFLLIWGWLLATKTKKQIKPAVIKRLVLTLTLGIGLGAFFLIPALGERGNIVLSQMPLADVSQHFVSLKQLILPSWGYDSPGEPGAFSFQLGWVHLIGLLAALVVWFKNREKKESRIFIFTSVSLLALVLLVLPVSLLFWR